MSNTKKKSFCDYSSENHKSFKVLYKNGKINFMGSKLNKMYMALKAVNGSFVELRINKTLVIMWHQNKKKVVSVCYRI